MNKENLKDKLLKQFITDIIFDYNNNNLNKSKIKNDVVDYLLSGKFFEKYKELLNDKYFIKQIEIDRIYNKGLKDGKKEIKEMLTDQIKILIKGCEKKSQSAYNFGEYLIGFQICALKDVISILKKM